MAFLNMKVEQMIRWKVFTAFGTPIRMRLDVVRLIFRISREGEQLAVSREGTGHDRGCKRLVQRGVIQPCDL